jgi:hypothetical protein
VVSGAQKRIFYVMVSLSNHPEQRAEGARVEGPA